MDVSNLCRSCMVEIASWECEDVDQKTVEMFSFCTNIEIPEDDKLPKHFCYNCTVLLESAYAYIRTARRINGKLKKLVQNGCKNFVDNFLNKTNTVSQIIFTDVTACNEKVEKSQLKLLDKDPDVVTEEKITVNNLDEDLFDDDDDKCLSELKTLKEEAIIKPDQNEETKDTIPIITNPINNNIKPKTSETGGVILEENFCKICDKKFSTEGWYTRHMNTAHGAKDIKKKRMAIKKKKLEKKEKKDKDVKGDIKCRVCGKVFASKHARTKHLNDEHSETIDGQKVFLCPYCPKTFTKYSNMYYHTTSHPDLAKHPCKTCGKVYRIRKELDTHSRTHLKDRPFACDKCDMRFKLKGILVTHIKWHEGVRPYLCSICGRSFLQSGNLESHMRVHTGERPFACSLCPFRSTSGASLKRHELRHRGERPYPCTHCPKRFFESCSLTRHLRCHTRERPYRCPYCSREFFDSGKRRRHFIMTHKMAPDEIPPMDKSGSTVERTALNGPKKRTLPWKSSTAPT